MCVGGELVDISRTPGNGQVYDVNSYALAAAGRDAGAEVNRVGIVDTEPKELREIVEGQLNRAEVVVIAGAVGGAAAEGVRSVLRQLGEMEVTRIAMHPGSVQGFGQLGPDGVPVFLLPANPVSALVVFEVMVRPLIRLSLGKRQPMRRVVQARTLSPIASVAGPQGLPARPADARPGHRRVSGAGARRRARRVVASAGDAGRGKLSGGGSRPRPNRSAPARSSTSRSWPSAAEREIGCRHEPVAFAFAASGVADAGRTAAGAGRCGPAAPGAAARRGAVEPHPAGRPRTPGAVGADDRCELGSATCGFGVAIGVFGLTGRSAKGPDAAVCDRGRRASSRSADDRQRDPRRAALGMDRLLGRQRGRPVAAWRPAALALGLDHCFGPVMLHRVEATVRPENAASRAVLAKVGLPRGRPAEALSRRRRRVARPPAGGDHGRGIERLGGLGAGARRVTPWA